MIIIDWFKWKWYTWRYNFVPMKTSDGRWIVACFDHWNKSSFNASGRLLSKKNAEELAEQLRSFKTFRDSKTEEGRDFGNPEVKAWLKRQRKKEVK